MAGLYIHIPFCGRKCPYCDFYSKDLTSALEIDKFLEALFIEMRIRAPEWKERFSSIYIGGGTPSVLSPDQFALLFENLRNHFTIADAEITVEVNPDSVSAVMLKALKTSGVNRLSIGIQSFRDAELCLLGRCHSVDKAVKSFKLARQSGYTNISIDLIYGLPEQSLSAWKETLQQALRLNPEHISTYSLTVHEKTQLAKEVREGKLELSDDSLVSDMFLAAGSLLSKAGYIHYEVSNYAVPGMESRHNSGYWDHTPYLGLGPSAHSFKHSVRFWNVSDTANYIASLNEGRIPRTEEQLKEDQLRLERIALGLRTNQGIAVKYFKDTKILTSMTEAGLGVIEGGHFRPTPRGFLLADQIGLSVLGKD